VPLRTCIACQEKQPKRELIRVVRTPEGRIEVDPKGKRAGRGAYLCSSGQCWEVALDGDRLKRALRCPVSAEDERALRAFAESLVMDGTD
jgi:predicted RNA-binding protein YlxR (DUF448 family)